MFKKGLIITMICVLIDQIIKMVVTSNMSLNSTILVIPNFFSITYVKNDGAAWSILSGNTIFLILISIVALLIIIMYVFKNSDIKTFEFMNYSILIGGILGNLFDRIKFGSVIDYLDFKIFNYNFPIFNFADMCIVVSIFLLLIYFIKSEAKNARNNIW